MKFDHIQVSGKSSEELEQEFYLLHKLTEAITLENDFSTAIAAILKTICEGTSWIYSEVWYINSKSGKAEFAAYYAATDLGFLGLDDKEENLSFNLGKNLVDKAWLSKSDIWLENATSEPFLTNQHSDAHPDFKQAVAVPIPLFENIYKVFCFYRNEINDYDKIIIERLNAIGPQLGMIIKQKQGEEDLKRSDTKYLSLMESSPNAIFQFDKDNKIIYLNSAVEKVFGYTKEELMDKPFNIIIAANQKGGYIEGAAHVLAWKEEKKGNIYELIGLKKGGIEFPVCVSIGKWKEDSELFCSAIFQDISRIKSSELELKKLLDLFQHTNEELSERMGETLTAQNELRKANETLEERVKERTTELIAINQQLKEFAYIVSHDLKAPLRAVSTLSGYLIDDYAEKLGEEGKEQLLMLKDKVKRMADLVEGILQFAKAGSQKGAKEKINLNVLVKEITEFISLPANIKFKLDNELPVINAEHTPVFQIFQNLIDNAVKYNTTPDGTINVGVIDDQDYWKFYIADNGPGIPEKYFEHVFKVFQTLPGNKNSSSTGVGLSVVEKNVKSMGGKIWIESEPGKGSTFFFTLPKSLAA